jgi:hypothetical protein
MKSKSSIFILAIVALAIIGAGLYFFVFKKSNTSTTSAGLVSSKTGTSQGLQNTTADQDTTGSQVVAILRNLSVIRLDDSVFRNPAFALLTDISISLPPITNQGRRNPFAPVGTDAAAAPVLTTGTTTEGPSF